MADYSNFTIDSDQVEQQISETQGKVSDHVEDLKSASQKMQSSLGNLKGIGADAAGQYEVDMNQQNTVTSEQMAQDNQNAQSAVNVYRRAEEDRASKNAV